MGTVWVILAMQLKTYDELLTISPITISINALSTATDVLIAGSLCFMLRRSRTGFRKSDTMINTLMLFVVNTGVLTSCCAIAALIALVASPFTLIYASFYFCIGRLYTNSLLATLNARELIRRNANADDNSHMLQSIPQSLFNTHNSGQKQFKQNISIRIDKTEKSDQPDDRSHQPHNLDRKLDSDEDLIHDTLPHSVMKDRDSQKDGYNYAV